MTSTAAVSTPNRSAWFAFGAAATLAVVGTTLCVAGLDPFMALALMPLVVALCLLGFRANRDHTWPPSSRSYPLATIAPGLVIYGLSWLYGLAHPPVAI